MLYECHITIDPPGALRKDIDALARMHKFKTSQIDGDPSMGDRVFFYLTGHDVELNSMRHRMDVLAAALYAAYDVKVLRRKIEHIVLDERF